MSESLAISKISVGGRIALGRDVCDALDVREGDKIVIYRTASGEIALKNAKTATP